MPKDWISQLKYNPLPPIQGTTNLALRYFIKRDLLNEYVDDVQVLWTLPEPLRILKKQSEDGAWEDKSKSRHLNSPTNYRLLETYRALGELIEYYGFDKRHKAICMAKEYITSTQSVEGDFRGIYGNQISTNYSAGILELLVKAGFHEEEAIHRAFKFFIKTQQTDGGWILPMQVAGIKTYESEECLRGSTIHIDENTHPSAHFATGIVIRPFANHPFYKKTPQAQAAAELLMKRFFKPDLYSARGSASYWTKYTYPFWWSDLISILDALATMKIPVSSPGIQRALNFYKQQQNADGSWNLYILKGKSAPDLLRWLSFILCRAIKRFYEQ
jgi:hypothetical protein